MSKHVNEETNLLFTTIIITTFVVWLRYKNAILVFYNNNRYVLALCFSVCVVGLFTYIQNVYKKWRLPIETRDEVLGPSKSEDCVYVGNTDSDKAMYIKQSSRQMHTQIVGTTNAGKTESIILPWAIDDIKKGRGLVIIDGKSDRSLLDKLYAYAVLYRREYDLRILSLCNPEISHTFNPLTGGSPLEITERLFKSLTFENEYFKNLQYEALLQVLLIFEACKITPTPLRVVEMLRSPRSLKYFAILGENSAQINWAHDLLSLTREEREQRTSGLLTQLQILTVGSTAGIFNSEKSDIDFDNALSNGHIVYCQLPVLRVPTLGKTVGKLVLQCVQGAAASRHLDSTTKRNFFSVYLDDFTEYLTEGFVSLLNKSRSANLGIVFAHQALGDLATLGEAVKNTILTNANLKIFMRTNEPTSAEYFSQTIGTIQAEKLTERQQSGALGSSKTGEGSVRAVEEFKFHPNLFKQSLGVGEAVVVLPHAKGSLPFRVKFRKSPDLDKPNIPVITKSTPSGLPPVPDESTLKENKISITKNILVEIDSRKEAA